MNNLPFHDQTKYPTIARQVMLIPLVILPILGYGYREDIAFVLLLGLVWLILVLSAYYMYKTGLTIQLTAAGVSYTLQGFSKKENHIALADILNLEVIALDYTGKFGGWGHRKNKNGTAYVFNDGLFLHVETKDQHYYFSISDNQKDACKAHVEQYNFT